MFVTTDVTRADQYAKLVQEVHPNSQAVTFQLKIPEATMNNLKNDELEDSNAFRLEGTVKPEWIKSYRIGREKSVTVNAAGGTVLYAVVVCLPPNRQENK